MMYKELYQYLLQYKQLPVPGVGTFLLERKPAVIDFPNKKINPPVYTIALQPTANSTAQNLFIWLGSILHISNHDAVIRFNDFAFNLKKQLADGDIIIWDGVGTISKGLAGDVKFISGAELLLEKPVTAEKVIRENAGHMVRVGEEEKTSAEMTEMLNKPQEKKSYWWAYALAVALLAVMFTGWYFSEHGLDIAATSNAQKLIPGETGATYKQLP